MQEVGDRDMVAGTWRSQFGVSLEEATTLIEARCSDDYLTT